jgi:hypothetical protein
MTGVRAARRDLATRCDLIPMGFQRHVATTIPRRPSVNIPNLASIRSSEELYFTILQILGKSCGNPEA